MRFSTIRSSFVWFATIIASLCLLSCSPDLSFQKTVAFKNSSTGNILGKPKNAINLRTDNIMRGFSYRSLLAVSTSNIMGSGAKIGKISTSKIKGIDYIMLRRYSTSPLP